MLAPMRPRPTIPNCIVALLSCPDADPIRAGVGGDRVRADACAQARRRAGPVRGDGRPRPQADLARPARDGQARRPHGPGGRRRLLPVGPRQGARLRAHGGQGLRRLDRGRRLEADRARLPVRRRRLPRHPDLRGPGPGGRRREVADALPRDPAVPVRGGGPSAGCRRTRRRRARGGRKAVRPRPRERPEAQRRPARRVPRGADLPHRPLSRQGAGREPDVLPLRQRVPRAGLEPQQRRGRPDHDGRGLRSVRTAGASTTRRARSGTSSRTTCSRSWPG